MPDKGLKDVLNMGFKQNFTVVSAEDRPSLHTPDFIQELLRNYAIEGEHFRVHFILCAYDITIFTYNKRSTVYVYDFVRNPFHSLEHLTEQLSQNLSSCDNKKNILIVDDIAMFLIFSSGRQMLKPVSFFRKLKRKFTKIVVFLNKETMSVQEIAVFYDLADAVAMLRTSHGPKPFVCDLLKLKSGLGGKVRHEQTAFEVIHGELRESVIQKEVRNSHDSNQDDVLRNLTTFKLTLEENEKESKSRLHLPYFEAQKTSVSDTSTGDYYDDDDEDDEEV